MTRVLDGVEKVLVTHEIVVTDFFDPHLLNLAKDILLGFQISNFNFLAGIRKLKEKGSCYVRNITNLIFLILI